MIKKITRLHKINFIKIANCVIRIIYTNKTKVVSFLNDFFVHDNKKYNYSIIFFSNKKIAFKKNPHKNFIVLPYNINVYIFQYLLRNIIQDYFEKNKNGFFLHCSGICIDNNAYLFLGPQGSGKSTIVKILRDIALPLADDSGVIVKEENNFYFYQTPFIEKTWFKKSTKRFHINKIFFIKKAKFFKSKHLIDRNKILSLFIKQLWTDKKRLNIQVQLLMQLIKSFNQIYELYFPKNKEVVLSWFIKHALN